MKGPNDIWPIVSGYLSRYGYREQLSYLTLLWMTRNIHEASPLLSRRYEPRWLTDAVFCLSVAQTSFTDCRDYFGSNDRPEKKNF